MDDHVAMLVAKSAKLLIERAHLALQALRSRLGGAGFVVNWAPGKTEGFLALRGKPPWI